MPATSHTSHPLRRHLRAARILLIGALLAACASAGVPAAAQAGDYYVDVCKRFTDGAPLALPQGPYDWHTDSQAPPYAAQESCASGGPMVLQLGGVGLPAYYGTGAAGDWTASFPGPVVSVIARRSVTTTSGPDMNATPQYITGVDAWGGTLAEGCQASDSCQLNHEEWGDTPGNDAWIPTNSAGNAVRLFVNCGSPGGGVCVNTGVPRVRAVYHRIEITVRDSWAPSGAQKDATGTATDGITPHQGTVSLNMPVSDRGGGVWQAFVSIGGRQVLQTTPNVNGGKCADISQRPQVQTIFANGYPCSTNFDMKLNIDTTKAPDGQQPITVDLVDAGGNRATVYSSQITVDNIPAPANTSLPVIFGAASPRPGDTLTAKAGSWQGNGITYAYRWQRSTDGAVWADIPYGTGAAYTLTTDDVDRTIRVVVTATNTDGKTSQASEATPKVKSGATVQVASVLPGSTGGAASPGGNGAGGNPSTGQLVVDREQRTVDVKYGAKIVITGRLVDADGQPIADASVDVFEQLALTAAAWNKIGTVRTDSQGGYVFRPQTLASRHLRFAYSDKRDGGDYRATREVFISVTAGMTITSKHHVLRPGGLIKLSGHVQVASLPPKGAYVEVQVLDAGVWRAIAIRRTSSRGKWTFKHRLSKSAGITFRFRARLRPAGDLASAEALSKPLKVRVR